MVNQIKKIEFWPLEKLTPYEKNSKLHPEEQVEQIAKSIQEFGFNNPILVDRKMGIIAGHGRLLAAKHLSLDEVPVVILDHLNDAQKRAYIIADNKLAENAQWDNLNLKSEIEALQDLDFDIDLLGFSEDEMNDLFPEVEVIEGQTPEDEVPEVKKNPITKRGDIWLLGNHRLMCGDSTMIDDVEKLMNGEKADMVFTDPPYGIGLDRDRQRLGKSQEYGAVLNDGNSSVAKEVYSWSLAQGFKQSFFWGANHYADVVKDSPCWVVWDKQGGKSVTFADCELCHTNLEKPVRMFTHIWDGFRKDSEKGEKRVHPTQKPIKLFIDIWDCFDSPDSVLDLFLGSGSTLIACEKTNRQCYGMELDEKYCDVILDRWQNFTGKQATLESTGEKYNDLCQN